MLQRNIDGYRKVLSGKAEMEHWEITVEDDNDNKLYEMFFGEFKKQKKLPKKMKMESLVFIVFGRNAVNQLLTEGFK